MLRESYGDDFKCAHTMRCSTQNRKREGLCQVMPAISATCTVFSSPYRWWGQTALTIVHTYHRSVPGTAMLDIAVGDSCEQTSEWKY